MDWLFVQTRQKKSNLKFALQNDLQVLGLEPTELFFVPRKLTIMLRVCKHVIKWNDEVLVLY